MIISSVNPITVGGFNIVVKDGTEGLNYQGLAGTFVGARGEILVRTDCGPEMQAQTLLHEVGHAVESVYLEADQLSEAQLSAFTQGWFQVMRDNPQFIQAIMTASYLANSEEGEDDSK